MANKTTDDDNELFDDAGILKDGVRLRTPMYAMDSVQRSIRDAMHPSLSKPGYRFLTDAESKQRIDDAHAEYRREISERWRTNDQKEGDSCRSPTGESGVLRFVSGRLVCTPVGAATTPDSNKLLDEGWDAEYDREQAYLEYDAWIRDAWARSK